MSVRCKDCGVVADHGHEIGHKSDCPALERAARAAKLEKVFDDYDAGLTFEQIVRKHNLSR